MLMTAISAMLVVLIGIQLLWLRSAERAEQRERQMKIDKALAHVSDRMKQESFCFESFGKAMIDTGEAFFMMHRGRDGKSDTIDIYYSEDYSRKHKAGKMSVMDLSLPFMLDIQLRATVMMEGAAGFLAEKRAFYESSSAEKLADIIRTRRPIDSMYQMKDVDSAIRANLAAENIDTNFGFAIVNPEENKVAYKARIENEAQLAPSQYRISLFTGNQFMNPYELVLVFPNNATHSINYLLLLSVAIILLLTFAFIAFVRMYLQQSQLSQMKSDFINNLTHEFNTPMANISLALETLDASGRDIDNKTRRVIDIIAMESARLRENIECALQVAAAEDGALVLHKEEVDLVSLLNTVTTSYSLQCETLGGSVSFSHSGTPTIYADETHLLNCVVNLLDNAIKYRNGRPEILILLEEHPAEVVLSVTDNGIGMTGETQKHVFEKFYRAHEGNMHNTKGFGLGLCYVKEIIEAHGGSINVTSKKGDGSTFSITLPKPVKDGK